VTAGVDPRPYDHLRAQDGGPAPSGVYRVVGVDEDRVTLLRVTDGSGRRRHTGQIRREDRQTLGERFAAADDPDAGLSLADAIDPFRAFLSALRYHLGRP
jgi:hypothetical protein